GELIMKSNNLEDVTRLQIGQVLLIPHPEFSVTISRKERKVTLFNHGRFFKEYSVKDWKVPPSKKPATITTKVTNKMAWKEGKQVAFGTKDYAGSARWIML